MQQIHRSIKSVFTHVSRKVFPSSRGTPPLYANQLLNLGKFCRPIVTWERSRSLRSTHGLRPLSPHSVTADECHVTTEATRKLLTLHQPKGQRLSFNATWLRFNCQCSECVQSDTGQILLDPSYTHPAYTIQEAIVDGDQVKLVWMEDGHSGSIPLSYLEENNYSEESLRQYYEDRTPEVVKDNEVPTATYEDVITSEKGLYSWIEKINEYGTCLLTDVPTEKGMVHKIFDVESLPNPINAAYSDVALTYHVDLDYYQSPPGVQMLHCIRFDDCVVGGESQLVDAWAAAEQLRQDHPEDFEVLSRVPATFQKIHSRREHPVWMRYQRTHITTGPTGNIIGVHWSPPFEGPLKVPQEDVEAYYKAYHQYSQVLNNSPTRLEFQLKEGDMISFNNNRMLHARKAFELNGGHRHLQGCYVHIDEFKSRVEVLSRKVGDGRPAKRVFNHDFF